MKKPMPVMFISDLITIEVRKGKAILSGNVYTWSERQEASRVANLTYGIRAVENLLTVDGVSYPWDEWYEEPGRWYELGLGRQ